MGRSSLWPLAVAAWGAVVGGGFYLLDAYDARPGPVGDAPASWPAGSTVRRAGGRPMLVVCAHPCCPCTRATVSELAQIMTRCQGRVEAVVLVFKPTGSTAAWERTDVWDAAAAIPGVRVVADEGGAEAARFGARTSGHTLLYGPDGSRWFSGGITAARGHAWDNAGRDAVVALLTGGQPSTRATPVFGCPIVEDEAPESFGGR